LTLLRHAVEVETMYSNSGYERQDYPNRSALEMSRLLVERGANVDIGGFALDPSQLRPVLDVLEAGDDKGGLRAALHPSLSLLPWRPRSDNTRYS
jgi:hypothetical protein